MSAALLLDQLEAGQAFVAAHQRAVSNSAISFADRFWEAESGDPDDDVIEARAAAMLSSVEIAYRKRDENLGIHSDAFVGLIVQSAAHALWKRLYDLRSNRKIRYARAA